MATLGATAAKNITGSQLRAQYERASAEWPFIHEVEKKKGLLPYLMFAIGSRETNLRNIWGDWRWNSEQGKNIYHGAGVWQRDIQHGVPDGWMEDVPWQCDWAADHLLGKRAHCNGDWLGACNAYNSGSCLTSRTTGKDYGPDVLERRQYLEDFYGAVSTEKEFVAVQSFVSILSGYAIQVAQNGKNDRDEIVQFRCNGQKNQSVLIEDAGNGLVRIKFEHSGKYLDGDPHRLEAVQFSRADVPGQLWRLIELDNGALVIENQADGRVLDVDGMSREENAKIILWEWKGQNTGSGNQQWVKANFR